METESQEKSAQIMRIASKGLQMNYTVIENFLEKQGFVIYLINLWLHSCKYTCNHLSDRLQTLEVECLYILGSVNVCIIVTRKCKLMIQIAVTSQNT